TLVHEHHIRPPLLRQMKRNATPRDPPTNDHDARLAPHLNLAPVGRRRRRSAGVPEATPMLGAQYGVETAATERRMWRQCAGGVDGTRSLRAAADDARPDGAQPPRGSEHVPRGSRDPSRIRPPPPPSRRANATRASPTTPRLRAVVQPPGK